MSAQADPKKRKIKGIAMIAFAALAYGGWQFYEMQSAADVGAALHAGDPVMEQAINRARQSYDEFFSRAVDPANRADSFRAKVAVKHADATSYVWVTGINRTVQKAAFIIPIGESNKATIISSDKNLPPVLQPGAKISFTAAQIVDWLQIRQDGVKLGAFTECANMHKETGRMELNALTKALKLDCEWIPQLQISSR
ncbi:MAG: hypothetical protein ACRC7G_05470 [Beijerinckiaceae bacterium]